MLGEVKEVQVVAQPLHQRAGDRDRAFERVDRRFVAQLIGHGRQQAVFAWDGQGAGVEQHEAAGAVGVLRLADAEAGLPDERRLLVAQVAADGHLAQGVAVDLGVAGRADRGQHPARDVQDAQDLIVPVQRVQVHQQGAAGVGHIGHVRAAVGPTGQVPDDPRVDVAEDRLAPLRRRAHTGHVVEDPLDLRAGEIGRQRQPGLRPEAVLPASFGPAQDRPFGQLAADAVRAGVLPDDGVVVRLAGARVPDHRGLALVGDADRCQVVRRQIGFRQTALDHILRARPDLQRVVLDPAGLRVDLLVFELVDAHHRAGVIEDHEAGAGRALVDGSNVSGHGGDLREKVVQTGFRADDSVTCAKTRLVRSSSAG